MHRNSLSKSIENVWYVYKKFEQTYNFDKEAVHNVNTLVKTLGSQSAVTCGEYEDFIITFLNTLLSGKLK